MTSLLYLRFSYIKCLSFTKILANAKLLVVGKPLVDGKLLVDDKHLYLHLASIKMLTDLTYQPDLTIDNKLKCVVSQLNCEQRQWSFP